ncbi:hypothetical protein llap_19643 [Limosa lapponica baueri]|uniref:Aspartyl beta-hydroxylase/Triadin domain-containing protein n=1 Tax=Limosa lapponica baueri TaxID=1758121 RepID=A0A2I0T8C8_LIMLA|nr:hypothetical protein llap_19643 [Limosa lapponica baueri]
MADDTESKHGGSKNGKKEGLSGSSFFTWFMVIALLGVWTSVAVVWFELVDYEEVLESGQLISHPLVNELLNDLRFKLIMVKIVSQYDNVKIVLLM